MLSQDLLNEIEQLPLDEQLTLLERLAQIVRRRTSQQPSAALSAGQLRGLLKPVSGETPSDNDLRDDYTDHLLRKYS